MNNSSLNDKNHHHLVMDIVWFGIAFPSVASFLSVYAIRLGADATILALISSLPAIITMLSSALSVWWRSKFSNTVHAQLIPGIGFRMLFLLPVLTPFFPHDWQKYWLVLSMAIPAIPQGVSSVIFLVLMRESVDRESLTGLLSRRSLAFNVAVGISTLGLGFWLKNAAFPLNYQVMFLGAFIFSFISLWHVSRVRVIHPEPAATPDHPAIKPWRSAGFMRSAFIIILAYVTLFMIIPIIRLRLVNEMGADEAFMSYFSIAELSAAALSSMRVNWLAKRIGNLAVISLGLMGTGLAALIIALSPTLEWTLIGAALGGGSWAAAAVCIFGFFSENTPPESITRYSMLFNQIVGLSMFIGPMVGSWLADTSLSLVAVLLIGAGMRFVAGMLTLYHPFKHVGEKPPIPAD